MKHSSEPDTLMFRTGKAINAEDAKESLLEDSIGRENETTCGAVQELSADG